MCSNLIPRCSADLYCTALTRGNFSPGRTPPESDGVVSLYRGNTAVSDGLIFQNWIVALLSCLSLSLSLFLPSVLETAKCGFSASRWDWWACATQTSRRSTNVSVTLAPTPNAPPQWATMSQNTNRPDYQHPIKAFTQANGEGAMLFLTRGC